MKGPRSHRLGLALVALGGLLLSGQSPAGPTHEAVVPPPGDAAPAFVDRAPPAPLNERPGPNPPSPKAASIPGYWEWDAAAGRHAWVAGIWREPPPGRFWANGYWRHEPRGWTRVPGFWTDRPVDRIAWRKEAPPAIPPGAEAAPPSPGGGAFFVPGHYAPEGDGLAWKQGYWARPEPGREWAPARWVRQPRGWTFQEGFWDRPLADRATPLPQVAASEPARLGDTAYRPPAPPPGKPGPAGEAAVASGHPGMPAPSLGVAGRGFALAGFVGPSVVPPAPAAYRYPNQIIPPPDLGHPVASGLPTAEGFGGYSYYGHGLGFAPGYYGGSPTSGYGLGFTPGYYGGSGFDAGRTQVQQGGLGGFPQGGHGLGFYPGYYGQP